MTEPLLIERATILTLGEPGRVLHDHDLLIDEGVIAAIAPAGHLGAARSIDASGKILMPGFINAHMHCYSTFARGLTKTAPAHSFPEVLDHLWWRLDKALTLEDSYYSALVVLLEAIRNGTTTLIDHHASPSAIRGSLAAIARAFDETGLRGCLCYEVSDRDGPAAAEAGLTENAGFIRACSERNDPRLKAMFGLHASFTLGDDTLRRAAELGHALGAGFHIHAAEAAVDQELTLQQHGMRVIERLEAFGLLGPASIAAHCVHIDGREMDLLAGSGTAVVHNPQSNMNNATGIADITTMQQRGVLVGLGTDAMTTRMSEEVRTALWGQHLLHRDPAAGFTAAASSLLVHNPAIARRIFGLPLGEIAVGAPADLLLIDYIPPTPLNQENWPGQFIFGIAPAPVDTTIVAGRVLMRDKQLLLDLDEREIGRKAREQAEALWKRM